MGDAGFSGTAITVVGVLLTSLTGALTFIFKLLNSERDKHTAFLELALAKAEARIEKQDATNDIILAALNNQTRSFEELMATVRTTIKTPRSTR